MFELVSFVMRGKTRRKLLSVLVEPRTPTQACQLIKTHRSTTSRSILILEKKGLVECVTPKERMGRLYRITKLGKKVLSELPK